ncbi:MAG: ferritin-like protein [Bacteroidetes bacterium]|nr:ferritin-like protein [Bacteroidota bacterium]
MKHPANWNKSDLHQHLQHAVDLELWTIPLYLTSLYSIRDLTKLKHVEFPEAAKLIFSVVIQEMLHVELVCNVCHALGYNPKFKFPSYDVTKGIPFIHPPAHAIPDEVKGYEVRIQELNKESLKLFCAIELPHPKKEIIWEKESRYNSIAELYEAIKVGIKALWDSNYVGDEKNTRQKNNFSEYNNQHGKKHGFSVVINSLESALKAIEAIIEQGEGADSRHVPSDFQPHAVQEGQEFDSAWYKGNLSHYQKFRILLHSHHKLPHVYNEMLTENAASVNQKLSQLFHYFWQLMEENFHQESDDMPEPFWNAMFALGPSIAEVWQNGMVPDFAAIHTTVSNS